MTKVKDGKLHPLLAMKAERDPKVKPFAIGVVYGADGAPKMDEDFVKNLSPAHRALVDTEINKRGYSLDESGKARKLEVS
jgi:hypothetical protein